ncbi:heat-shock protein HtpX, partial [Pseudomonas sp. ATCC 13867]
MFALSFSAIAEDMPGMKMDGMNMESSQAAAPASA